MLTPMRFFQRTAVILLIIALGTWLFYIGREHQIFFDNRTITRGEQNFRALEQVNVSVDGGAKIELLARDRDVIKTVGPSFMLRVEILDSLGGDVERVIELQIRPEFKRDMLINIPLLAAGRSDFILPAPNWN